MYKRCLFLKKDTNCKEQRSMAEKFEHVRLSCSGTTANSDNFTQQSSLLVVEAFATKPCWTSYWVSFRDVASYFGCCRKGLCFFWKPPRHLGGAWDFVTCSAYREACAGEGKNYIAFLRELLQFFAEAYERDPQMKARLLLALIYIYRKPESCLLVVVVDLLMTSFVIISLAGCDTNQDSYRRYPSREVESFCCTKPTFHLVKSVRNDLKLKTLL